MGGVPPTGKYFKRRAQHLGALRVIQTHPHEGVRLLTDLLVGTALPEQLQREKLPRVEGNSSSRDVLVPHGDKPPPVSPRNELLQSSVLTRAHAK